MNKNNIVLWVALLVLSYEEDDDYIEEAGQFNMQVTCDNEVKVYVDGQPKQLKRSRKFDWRKLNYFSAGRNPKIIAVKCVNLGGYGGILLSGYKKTHDGSLHRLLSDRSWKCTRTWHEGWMTEDFDDVSWTTSRIVSPNMAGPSNHWLQFDKIPKEVSWIWAGKRKNVSFPEIVFCRYEIKRSICSAKCDVNARCVLHYDDRFCVCNQGYLGNGSHCVDINECEDRGSCDSSLTTCKNTDGGYQCACKDGHQYCEDDGIHTNDQHVQCDPSFDHCYNGTECTNSEVGFVCKCIDDFLLTPDGLCENDIDDEVVSPCTPNPCFNEGTCVSNEYGFNCTCPPQYHGLNCQHEIGACYSTPCFNNATCISLNDYQVSCDCREGFTGIFCEIEIDECSSNPCLNGGTCVDQVMGYSCQCKTGYEGDECEDNINPCSHNPCQNNGTCVDDVAGFTCFCRPGFVGVSCETDYDECASHPCLNGGTCANLIGEFRCSCSDIYTGLDCAIQVEKACLEGYFFNEDIYMCQDKDECETGVDCPENSNCENTEGSYICKCNHGFIEDRGACVLDFTPTNSEALETELNQNTKTKSSDFMSSAKEESSGSQIYQTKESSINASINNSSSNGEDAVNKVKNEDNGAHGSIREDETKGTLQDQQSNNSSITKWTSSDNSQSKPSSVTTVTESNGESQGPGDPKQDETGKTMASANKLENTTHKPEAQERIDLKGSTVEGNGKDNDRDETQDVGSKPHTAINTKVDNEIEKDNDLTETTSTAIKTDSDTITVGDDESARNDLKDVVVKYREHVYSADDLDKIDEIEHELFETSGENTTKTKLSRNDEHEKVIFGPCKPNPCENRGTCSRERDGVHCECQEGYIGQYCEFDIADCRGDLKKCLMARGDSHRLMYSIWIMAFSLLI